MVPQALIKNQNNQMFITLCLEVMQFSGATKTMYQVGVENGLDLLEVIVINEAPLRSGVLGVKIRHGKPQLRGFLGGAYPYSGEC